jgi:hypothetical protein
LALRLTGIDFRRNEKKLVADLGYQVICSDGVVKRYPAKPIEGVVVKRMKDFVSSNEVFMTLFAGAIKQDKSNLSEVSKKISSAKVRIQTLKDSLEIFNQNIRAVMSDTNFAKDSVVSLLNERSQLESEIANGEVGLLKLKKYYDSICDDNLQVDFHKRLTKFVRAYDGLPNCDKKQIIQSLFPKIILESEDSLKILVNPAFDEQGCDEREKIVSKKWRERRDSNPRPSA